MNYVDVSILRIAAGDALALTLRTVVYRIICMGQDLSLGSSTPLGTFACLAHNDSAKSVVVFALPRCKGVRSYSRELTLLATVSSAISAVSIQREERIVQTDHST